jgi:hypothetical protein
VVPNVIRVEPVDLAEARGGKLIRIEVSIR